MVKYKRILLKISGEALSNGNDSAVSAFELQVLANEIKQAVDLGVQMGIVVGGGNFWRGRQNMNITRSTADYVGILATVMNGLVLNDALQAIGVKSRVVTSVAIDKVAEPFFLPNVLKYLNDGEVVIFGGGTGSAYFTTDTAAALRACEIGADAVLCAKSIDGVYDSDPKTNKNAVKYEHLTYDQVLEKNLKVLDLTATAMCREYGLPLVVFSKDSKGGIKDAVLGKKLGTIIE